MTRQNWRRETLTTLMGVGRIIAPNHKRNVRRKAALKWTRQWWKDFRNEGRVLSVKEIVDKFYNKAVSK